jgi:hypothetical protein
LDSIGVARGVFAPVRPSGHVQIGDSVIDAVAEFGFIDAGCTFAEPSRLAMRSISALEH